MIQLWSHRKKERKKEIKKERKKERKNFNFFRAQLWVNSSKIVILRGEGIYLQEQRR